MSYLALSDLKLLMQTYSGLFISIIHYAQNTIASTISDILSKLSRADALSPIISFAFVLYCHCQAYWRR